jgi:pimeloyl-ACP methyl ester carboxylesterase
VAREVWWTVLRGYHDDMKRARDRITAAASMTLRTQFGIIEYADRGAGTLLLVSHGVLGCHVDGVDGYWSTLPGPGFRVIAPARFGYFGSTLPRDASPADQADAYRLLLDHLGVERAVVIGYSAGSASVLEFAARHPSRVIALILASARLGGGVTLNKRLEPALRVAYGSDLLFWIFKRLLPSAYARMMGAPKGYRPTPAEARTLAGYLELLFPLKPRREGATFDGFVSNVRADRFPLEDLAVPTLVISAVDDRLAPYPFAAGAAACIPAGRLLTIERGGHLFLGHDTQVRDGIAAFVTSVARAREGRPGREGSTTGTAGIRG